MEEKMEEKQGEKKGEKNPVKPEIYVFQTDNRGMSPDYPFEFIPQSIRGNQKVCEVMGWNYLFREMNPDFYRDNHPAVGKIYMVHQWLQEQYKALWEKGSVEFEKPTFLVFLDTDAWIQDASRLRQLLNELGGNGKYGGKRGAFSRDPYIRKNTYVNSGSFILRVDASLLKMYEELLEKIEREPRFLREWPWDQVYVSSYVWERRNEFLIFKPDVLNSGHGKILRHNWHKTSRKIRDDLYFLCCFPIILNEEAIGMMEDELDDKPFPNLEEVGYDYMDFD
jgi:hypothetical protein